MQRLLQPLLEGSKTSQSSADSEGRDYPVTRTHLRQLELYLEKINNWNQKGEDPEAQFEQEKDRRGGSGGSTGGADWSEELIEFACQLITPESQDSSDNTELRNALRNYSSSMQTFQDEVEEMNERILMNRGANDDNKIKHFIVSNSHLDKSAGNLTTGTLYEIYNSTMVDNLVNIIHSLVADMNVSEDDASVLLGGSTAKDSTAQIMDLSDMRARTMPISSAMSIDLSNSAEVSYNTRYNEDSADQLFSGNSSIRKEALASLFTNAESPLYDSIDGQGNLRRLSDRVLLCFAMRASNSPWDDFFDDGAPAHVPGTDNDYNQGLGKRGLYIIILNEDKTKVAFDSNNAIWDYRAIYFYPAVEAIGSASDSRIVFPFATTQDGIFNSNSPGRISTGSVTLRPNFPEH